MDQPAVGAQAPVGQNDQAATGGQLSSIDRFEGEEGVQAELWCNMIEEAKKSFKWSDQTTASNAKQRMTGKARYWVDSERRCGHALDQWPELRTAFLARFYPVQLELVATDAMTHLKKGDSESVSEFFDRVANATDKLYYRIQGEARDAAFWNTFNSTLFTLYASGLPEHIRQPILGKQDPPTDVQSLLTACRAFERQNLSRQKRLTQDIQALTLAEQAGGQTAGGGVRQVAAVSSTATNDQGPTSSAKEPTLTEAVVAAVKAAFPANRPFTGNCYHCGKPGHIQSNCFARQAALADRGRGQRGRGRPFRGRGRGGRGRGRGFGRGIPVHEIRYDDGFQEVYDYEEAEGQEETYWTTGHSYY